MRYNEVLLYSSLLMSKLFVYISRCPILSMVYACLYVRGRTDFEVNDLEFTDLQVIGRPSTSTIPPTWKCCGRRPLPGSSTSDGRRPTRTKSPTGYRRDRKSLSRTHPDPDPVFHRRRSFAGWGRRRCRRCRRFPDANPVSRTSRPRWIPGRRQPIRECRRSGERWVSSAGYRQRCAGARCAARCTPLHRCPYIRTRGGSDACAASWMASRNGQIRFQI